MSRFRRTIDYCQIKELRLQNWKYTWATKGATLLLFGSTESSVTRVGTWLLMAAPYMPFPPPTLTIARCF
jgi:hypothetical protein